MPRRHAALWPILLLALGTAPLHGASERQLKEAELRQLRSQISTLQQQLQQVRGEHDRLQGALRESEQAISHLSRNIRQLDQSMAEVNRRVSQLRARQQDLQTSLQGQKHFLAGQVRAAYAMGRQETLKILLNQENPATVGRVMTYYDYLNKARTQRIDALRETLDTLEQVHSSLQQELARLRELRQQRDTERAQLASVAAQRQQVLAQLASEMQLQGQQLGQMQQDEQQLAALIRALAQALDDIPADIGAQPFAGLRGKLPLPVTGPVITRFGSERGDSGLQWQGIRIAANDGQEVRAVSHGRVAFADWLRGYGMLVIVDHNDGYMSLYGHNQVLLKEVGDWVNPREVIALVGDGGPEQRSGLYFEIRKDGRPLDPIRWVRR